MPEETRQVQNGCGEQLASKAEAPKAIAVRAIEFPAWAKESLDKSIDAALKRYSVSAK